MNSNACNLHPTEAELSTEQRVGLLRDILVDIGLTGSEAEILGTLLRSGSRQASNISRSTGVSRAQVYSALSKLQEQGLVSVHERGGTRFYTAMPLAEIENSLEKREQILANRRKQLTQLSNFFQSSPKNTWSDPVSKTYKGSEAIARLFQELSQSPSTAKFLFCSAANGMLFQTGVPSQDTLNHLLHLGGDSLQIILFAARESECAVLYEVGNPRIRFYPLELPMECLISGDTVFVFGSTRESFACMSIEQPTFGKIISLLTNQALVNVSEEPNG